MNFYGHMSDADVLKGSLAAGSQKFTGTISLPQAVAKYPDYDGVVDVIPDAYDDQVLFTSEKVVHDDITVFKIPTAVVSNNFGKTFIIAS